MCFTGINSIQPIHPVWFLMNVFFITRRVDWSPVIFLALPHTVMIRWPSERKVHACGYRATVIINAITRHGKEVQALLFFIPVCGNKALFFCKTVYTCCIYPYCLLYYRYRMRYNRKWRQVTDLYWRE